MSTITKEQELSIAETVRGMRTLAVRLGDEDRASSMAAINLALTGELTEDVPECMSLVIGRWITPMQDAIPSWIRDSERWRNLLPRAAGTGRKHEEERLAVLMTWMWETAMPNAQSIADVHKVGDQWREMLKERTEASTKKLMDATFAVHDEYIRGAKSGPPRSAEAARALTQVVLLGDAAWEALCCNSRTIRDAEAEFEAVETVRTLMKLRGSLDWSDVDPCGTLEKLIAVSEAAP